MSALEVEQVAMSYGRTEVLTGVSLSVPAMSITAVLGGSGSGKTTLLRIVAGFERPRSGQVRLGDQLVDSPGRHVPPERRSIGYVAQEGALFPHLTVAANVGFGLRRSSQRDHRVDELLDLVGLADLRRRYPHELSGGQQQRVALARALAREPSVLLLDEPFSSLDAALRASVRGEIAAVLRATKTTVVLVTHDQQEALSMADQVAVLRQGQIAQVGGPRDVYSRPVDADLAAFLGDANLIDGMARDGVAVTALGPLEIPAAARGPVTVLVRPEQIAVSSDADGPGLRGHVTEATFHGHDCMVSVVSFGTDTSHTVRVRLLGGDVAAVGSAVTLRAFGSATAWPRRPSRPAPSGISA